MSKIDKRHLRLPLFAAFVIGIVAISAAPAANAFTPPNIVLERKAITVEYGEEWSTGFTLEAGMGDYHIKKYTSVKLSPAVPGTRVAYYAYRTNRGVVGAIYVPETSKQVPVGTYTVSIALLDGHEPQYAASLKLTVTPAKLSTDFRVVPDAVSESNLLMSTVFTGTYAQQFTPASVTREPSPAGTWAFTIQDSTGAVAATVKRDLAASDGTLATNVYWTDAEPGEQYTVAATFTPTSDTKKNFDIQAAEERTFTGAASQRPIATSTAPPAPAIKGPTEPVDFSLPLWVVGIFPLIMVILAATSTILFIRLRRTNPTMLTKDDAEVESA